MTEPQSLDYEGRPPRQRAGFSLAGLLTWIILALFIVGFVVVQIVISGFVLRGR
ncbi:MAG TPA: hypothetical protein VGI81_01645 [Tepidisphaeraceae bacterium]